MFTPFEARVNAAGPTPAHAAPKVFGTRVPPALYDRDVFEWLSAPEARVAAAMRSARRRAQFAAGRWLLRHAAASVFGAGRYASRTAQGRPQLTLHDGGHAAVSISHCADMVLCAAGRVAALGVDVERIRPRHDWAALSAFVLHAKERAGLDSAAEPLRWQRFYQAWTSKEALAKALGVGVFALPFDRILVCDGTLREAPPAAGPGRNEWQLRELQVGEGLAAALAWRT